MAPGEQHGWAKLGAHLAGEPDARRSQATARRPQLSLFDPPRRDQPRDDEPLLVKLSSIRLERTREFSGRLFRSNVVASEGSESRANPFSFELGLFLPPFESV